MPGPHPNPRVRQGARIALVITALIGLAAGIWILLTLDWSDFGRYGIPAPVWGLLSIPAAAGLIGLAIQSRRRER